MKDGDGTNKQHPQWGLHLPQRSGLCRGWRLRTPQHGGAPTASSPLEVKPDVCWQLPIRRTFEDRTHPDGQELSVVVISESSTVVAGALAGTTSTGTAQGTPTHVGPDPVYISEATRSSR